MALQHLLLVLFAAQLTQAQTDILGSIFSVAESFITSVFAPATTTSSSSSTTPTSTTSSSSSSSSTTATPSQSAAAASSPTAFSASSAVAAQASQTSASSSNGGGSGGSNTLAIVLGCTLGALALAAFLALLLFCRRRRQRSKTASKHHALSPSDDEAEAWHHEKPRVRSLKEPNTEVHALGDARAGDPLTHDHNALGHQNHQNPFVPAPPPARRSMHANGMHGDTNYTAHPFRPEDVHAYPAETSSNPTHGHHADRTNHTLAAGAGGAVLGGLAAHAKDRHDGRRSTSRGRTTNMPKSDHKFSEDERNALPEAAPVARRSGSVSRASAKEPWPFDGPGKKSSESARSGSRGLHHNQDHFSTPNQYSTENHSHSGPAMAGAAAAGGLTGAALANKSKSRSPHRKGILKQNISDSSNPSSLTTEDYLPTALSTNSSRPLSTAGPHELASSEQPTASRLGDGQRHFHGVSAPLAAAVATNESTRHHRRSGSGGPHTSTPLAPLVIPQEESPPIIPSRSPKRNSLDHSRARYSTANEGTVELPSQPTHNTMVSPTLDARRATENDGLLSPVSPISESQTGSWSKAQAASTGLGPVGPREKTSSQESTVVNTSSPDELSHKDGQSSGLVSAIQRIFNSGRPVSEDHEALYDGPYTNDVQSNREKRLRNVSHRKPAADRASNQPLSQYGDIADQHSTDVMPGSWENTPARRSGDSARSLPPRYRSRGNSYSNNHDDGFVPVPSDTHRHRSHSRPGYGIGSGDPFDLARTRTDSSMTGVSLSNYQEPAANASRPRSYRKSSATDYKEPTLADLRNEVVAEDRQRAQHAWRNSHPHTRSNSAGLRYGDDRELFNLVDQTTGHGRYYTAATQEPRGNMGGNVGRAY